MNKKKKSTPIIINVQNNKTADLKLSPEIEKAIKETVLIDEEYIEDELKRRYFFAKNALHQFLHNKYRKYHNMPVRLKKGKYTDLKERIGFYNGFDLPITINDGLIHKIHFMSQNHDYMLRESEFEIYKGKIKDTDDKWTQWVDVKCPHCSHVGLYNMRYLVWGLNCSECSGVIGVNDRVKKTKFVMGDFR